MDNQTDEDDLPVDQREGAEFVDGLETSADSSSGEGLSVELWKWNGQYFLKSTDTDPESDLVVGAIYSLEGRSRSERSSSLSDWHDLGAITARQAHRAMDDLFSELQDGRG